jgi:outer membrane protein TolC
VLASAQSARGEEIGVAAAALYPSFDLELRKRLVSEIDPIPQTETRHSAQIQFNYQLPLGGSSFSRKREAAQRKLAAQAAVDTELLQARIDILQRWSNWREAREIAPQLVERVAASESLVQAYDLQFDAARRSLNDLIAVREDRYRARVDLLENQIAQLANGAQVLSLLGRLRESLASDFR